jgi:pantoate kinase
LGRSSRSIFVPSAVSSFFEVCDEDQEGRKIVDPLKIGARGGGFRLSRGVVTKVTMGLAAEDEVWINGYLTPSARTSLEAVKLARSVYSFQESVRVEHEVELPIGCGFGTSAAGALGTILAIQDALGISDSSLAADLAHVAEVRNLTGLGTVIAAASSGGCMGLVTEPGAPSIGEVKMFSCNPGEYVFVGVVFGAINKSTVLASERKKRVVNIWGRRVLEAVLDDPTPSTLLHQSLIFAEKTGLATRDLLDLARYICRSGAEGAAQNMIGRGVHSLVKVEKAAQLIRELHRLLPSAKIISSTLYAGPPQVLTEAFAVDRVKRV